MCDSVRAETTLIDQRVMTNFRYPMRKREKTFLENEKTNHHFICNSLIHQRCLNLGKREKTMRKLIAKWGNMRRFLRILPYRGYPMRKLISHLPTPKVIISIK